MKRILVIGSILAVIAVGATTWQIQKYRRQEFGAISEENAILCEGLDKTEKLYHQRADALEAAEIRLQALTNNSGGLSTAGF
jgi:Tfp pilus assembly protein PilE